MALNRIQYRNEVAGTVRAGSTAHGESLTDVESYLQPLGRIGSSAAFGRGVCDGLRVSAAAGAAGVRIGPGSALDGSGRLVVLESGGVAVTDPSVDPSSVLNVPTVPVEASGVALDTAGASGAQLVTLTWREVQDGPASAPVLLNAPWLRLVPAADFADTGAQVVLAALQLDVAGAVSALEAGPRRLVQLRTGGVELRATRADGAAVEVAPAAALRVRGDGGVDVDVAIGAVEGPPALSVRGDGTVAVAGRLGIGTQAPAAELDIDQGTAGGLAVRLFGTDWGAGLQMANSAGGRTFGAYSGADGGWHVADVTASADRLVVDRNGDLSVGGSTGVRGALSVTGDSTLGTGANPVKVTSGWQGFPDAVLNHAEIANDTGTYKTLMIVGNRSAGMGRRVSVWDRLDVNGDMTVTGRIGVSGQPASPHNAGLAGGVRTWDLEAEGTIWCRGDIIGNRLRTTFGDVAERFPAAEPLEPGDVVGLDDDGEVRATRVAGDARVVGVVSTAPGLVLNAGLAPPDGSVDAAVTVALCGRVRCKVTSENGRIAPGDLLVPSSVAGHAMRAGPGSAPSAGSAVGKALQPLDGPAGLIDVLVLLA